MSRHTWTLGGDATTTC